MVRLGLCRSSLAIWEDEMAMKIPRRGFLRLVASAAALPTVPRIAKAQTYPTRPVHCYVGYAPGGGTDIFVRLVGQLLPARLGQPFVVENRPGASSNLATEAVVRAPADGYTLLGVDAAAAINAITTSASTSSATLPSSA